MIRICYKCRGAISVFLVLIMLPMFVCAGLCVDGTRVSVAKSSVSGAGDLALNAALSEYDEDLHNIYGLFAMSESMDDLQENVKRYFENTINNESALESSDSYTRNFVDSIVNSIFSGGEVDFNNVIDTQVEDDSFQLTAVDSSALAKPDIMKKQIVEYMKFRGPVNLGKGLLTKLGCIGDTAKQSKALKKKVEYEEKLEDTGNACKDAYNAIKEYNDAIANSIYSNGDINNRYNNSVQAAKNDFQQMTEYIVAENSNGTGINNAHADVLKIDGDYQNSLRNAVRAKTTMAQKLDEVERWLKDSSYIEFQEVGNTVKAKDTMLYDEINDLKDSQGSSLSNAQVYYTSSIASKTGDFKKFRVLASEYVSLYNTFDDTDEYDELDEEDKNAYTSKKNILEDYTGVDDGVLSEIVVAAENIHDSWRNTDADDWGNEGRKELYQWYENIDDIIAYLTDAVTKLQKVKDEVANLDTTRNAWDSSIDDLADGTVKTTMRGDYSDSAKDLNNDAVDALITHVNKNKTYFEGLKNAILGNTYNGLLIPKETSGGNYYGQFNKDWLLAHNSDAATYDGVRSDANAAMSDYYSESSYNASEDQVGQITSGQFFEYLEKIYGGFPKQENQDKKEDAKKKKKAILDAGNAGTDDATVQQTVSNPTESIDEAIGAEKLADIKAALTSANNDLSEVNQSSIKSDGSNKESTKNFKDNLDNISTVFEKLSKILENARDNLYIEEYVTDMFSCYTSEYHSQKDSTGDVFSSINSRNKLNDNKFYKSEVEYIIFNKDTPQENLKAAKAMIFAIRFALNSIYAFTAADIRSYTLTMATAIAGWSGFGVPIVQTILTFGLAMGESVVDVKALCNGKDVPLYKSVHTWTLSVQGLAATATDKLKDTIEGYATSGINDVFTKINNLAIDKVDDINNEIQIYTQETAQSMADSVKASIVNPLQTCILNLIGASYEPSDDKIREKIDEALGAIEQEAQGKSGVIATATVEGVALVRSQYETQLVELVNAQYRKYKDESQSAAEEITNAVNSKLDSIAASISTKVNAKVDEKTAELKTKISQTLSDTSDKAKAVAKQKIASAINEYNCSLGGVTVNNSEISSDTSKDMSGANGGVTMNYKEYMKVFALLAITTNANAILSRTAEMIQVNMASANGDFNIAKAYTMVKADAVVSIRTSFLDVVTTNGSSVSLDYSNLGTGRQKIKYLGINGY